MMYMEVDPLNISFDPMTVRKPTFKISYISQFTLKTDIYTWLLSPKKATVVDKA